MCKRNIQHLPHTRPQLRTWPTTQECALTRNPTDNLLVRRPALSPLSHSSQGWFTFIKSVVTLDVPTFLTPMHCPTDYSLAFFLFSKEVIKVGQIQTFFYSASCATPDYHLTLCASPLPKRLAVCRAIWWLALHQAVPRSPTFYSVRKLSFLSQLEYLINPNWFSCCNPISLL